MAITWGNAVGATSAQFKLGYEFSQDPATVLTGTTSVDLDLKLYIWTKYSVSDDRNSCSIVGTDTLDYSDAVTVSTTVNTAWSESNIKLIKTVSRTFAPSYGTTTPSSFTATLSGLETIGTGYQATVSGSWTTAARPYQVPAAPTGFSVTRVSDTQHNLAWTNNPTSSAPYTNVAVDRRTDGGTWVNVAWLAGTVAAWSDTTTSANHKYEYRVYGRNSSGASGYATASAVYTTPAAPTSAVATKSGSDIVVTWSDNSGYESGFKVYESQDGGAYALLATVGAGVKTYTHTSPSGAVTHRYQVKAYNGSLYSAASTTNTVQLLAAPSAPTGLTIASVFDATSAVTLTWTHNPVDTTGQTYYDIQYRIIGAGSWTGIAAVASTVSSHTFPASTFTNGKSYEVQVCTKGEHADYSPWSASKTFTTSAIPTATISAPADSATLSAPLVTVEWGYYDAESTAQSARKVTIYASDGTTVLYTQTVADAATSATPAYVLADGTTYVIGVKVRDGSGLWSAEDTVTVDVDYSEPMTPSVTVAYDAETGSASVTIDNPAPTGGEPAVVYNDVYRVIDGVASLVASGVDPNATVTDYLPLASGTTGYYAVAYSALPSAATSTTVDLVTTGADGWLYINGGSGYGTVVALRYGPEWQETAGRDRVLHQFAGQESPVEFSSSAKTRRVEVTAYAYGSATRDAFTELAELAGPHFFRDCKGRHMQCALMGVSVAEDTTERVTYSFAAVRTQS